MQCDWRANEERLGHRCVQRMDRWEHGRRCPSTSSKERSREKPVLVTPWPWTSHAPELWGKEFCCLSHPACDTCYSSQRKLIQPIAEASLCTPSSPSTCLCLSLLPVPSDQVCQGQPGIVNNQSKIYEYKKMYTGKSILLIRISHKGDLLLRTENSQLKRPYRYIQTTFSMYWAKFQGKFKMRSELSPGMTWWENRLWKYFWMLACLKWKNAYEKEICMWGMHEKRKKKYRGTEGRLLLCLSESLREGAFCRRWSAWGTVWTCFPLL